MGKIKELVDKIDDLEDHVDLLVYQVYNLQEENAHLRKEYARIANLFRETITVVDAEMAIASQELDIMKGGNNGT